MKTLLDKLLIHFDFLAHPSEGAVNKKSGQRKRKASKGNIQGIISPDSVYMRGPFKKEGSNRRTPAP